MSGNTSKARSGLHRAHSRGSCTKHDALAAGVSLRKAGIDVQPFGERADVVAARRERRCKKDIAGRNVSCPAAHPLSTPAVSAKMDFTTAHPFQNNCQTHMHVQWAADSPGCFQKIDHQLVARVCELAKGVCHCPDRIFQFLIGRCPVGRRPVHFASMLI